ncbi:50S ribosomal protein L18a [Candidatus Bathyarchaeota archaeon]|nr:50S ribosomal protein L18a [Candidatus Bathyarchaeota archaeon]
MSEVKIFRIRGEIKKPDWKSSFRKDLRAVKQEDAIDKVYKELGSKHRVKRFQIKIISIEEITPDMTENHIIRKLSEE